jgi:hypothetical protein
MCRRILSYESKRSIGITTNNKTNINKVCQVKINLLDCYSMKLYSGRRKERIKEFIEREVKGSDDS